MEVKQALRAAVKPKSRHLYGEILVPARGLGSNNPTASKVDEDCRSKGRRLESYSDAWLSVPSQGRQIQRARPCRVPRYLEAKKAGLMRREARSRTRYRLSEKLVVRPAEI